MYKVVILTFIRVYHHSNSPAFIDQIRLTVQKCTFSFRAATMCESGWKAMIGSVVLLTKSLIAISLSKMKKIIIIIRESSGGKHNFNHLALSSPFYAGQNCVDNHSLRRKILLLIGMKKSRTLILYCNQYWRGSVFYHYLNYSTCWRSHYRDMDYFLYPW